MSVRMYKIAEIERARRVQEVHRTRRGPRRGRTLEASAYRLKNLTGEGQVRARTALKEQSDDCRRDRHNRSWNLRN